MIKSSDHIEVTCDRCNQKLSEVVNNGVPQTVADAFTKAWEAGWVLALDEDVCYGCRVQ